MSRWHCCWLDCWQVSAPVELSGGLSLSCLAVTEETLCVGLARVGAEDQQIAAGTLQQMCSVALGGPLHSLVITGGSRHPLEVEMLSLFPVPEASSGPQSTEGPRP